MGSPERVAIIKAYDETMKQLLIVAVAVCAPMWPCALVMKGLDLGVVEEAHWLGDMTPALTSALMTILRPKLPILQRRQETAASER